MPPLELTGEEQDWREKKRAELLTIFEGEFGQGRPDFYWSVVGPTHRGDEWCGALCLWVLREAGLAPGVMWEADVQKKHYGFCYRLVQLKEHRLLQPGDIVYFNEFEHHAMFVAFEDNYVITYDGNQGQPKPVKKQRRPAARIAGAYSIEPFLAAALAAENAKREANV